MPAEGFAWRPTPELNRVFHQQHRDSRLKPPKGKLSETHFRLIRIIERHSEEEFFTRQHYHWTGSTSPGDYLTSALPRHYEWALKILRKYTRSLRAH